ncbi:MAG TPA: ABC transporter ATP-binding protein [Microbacteriaceae bacterium]|nr:ABC transporter ATP-binding protein [Microbacteriaceae bacterium]
MSGSDRPLLEVRELRHQYGSHEVIGGINLSLTPGEFVAIVGPSGAGKTTLLRTLSGLLRPTSGDIFMHGEKVDSVPSELAMVFQDYSRSLFPWMTVAANVNFPLRRMRQLSKAERAERVRESLESVGLAGTERKYPWQLSGGMQQRVAIARALAYRPSVLLMDEPFASVDAQTRMDLEDLILRVWETHPMTVLFVTHDIDESVYLSQRVLVLSKSPTRVVRDIAVPLPRARDQFATKALPEFAALREEIAGHILGRTT